MLLNKDKSCVVLIDVQDKLAPYVQESESVVERCGWVMRLATELGVPLMISEQYPRGLGRTVQSLQHQARTDVVYFDKIHFSCYREEPFINAWKTLAKQQVVLIGIETHVCVLQTAIDMQADGVDVFVVVDAVSSRQDLDHRYGLKRMKQAGIQLVTTEMIFFEWVEKAGSPEFKTLNQSFVR